MTRKPLVIPASAVTFAIAVKILPTISAFSAVTAEAPEICVFGMKSQWIGAIGLMSLKD